MVSSLEQSIYRAMDEAESDSSSSIHDSYGPASLPVSDRPAGRETGNGMLTAKQLAEWRWANVDNLDVFLRQVYDYYIEKGFYCIVLARALKMTTILFVVVFSTFLHSCIDYSKLRAASSLQEVRVDACLARTSWLHYLALYVFALLWIFKVFQYISDARTLWEIHDFYRYMLHIKENEIQSISWRQVVDRMVALRSINGASRKRLNAHDIVNRIMRQENYMIALYSKNILDLDVQLPIIGKYEFLTKILEWSISMCIEDYVFNERGLLRKIVLREDKRDVLAAGLRRRFQFAALMNIVLAPVAIFYMTLYYFFRYFNDFYSNPKNLGIRQYTPLAEWKFRELNELYHLFKRRLYMSDEPAKRYISQFPREKTELVLRFLIFVFSSFAAVLAALSIYDPELLNLEIRPNQSILFYLTSLGLGITVCRAALSSPQEQAIYQPEAAMRQIVEFTHYFPDEWEDRLHTEPVKEEFTKLYDLKPKMILRDLLSVALNPIVLGLNLANRSERIIDFFREFTVLLDDMGGPVCSLAVFNTDRINKVKARSDELDQFYSTQDGKMLKSYLNFMDVYGPPQSRNTHSMYRSVYTNQGHSFLSSQTSTQTPQPRDQDNDMEASVMGQYERIRGGLAPVAEEDLQTPAEAASGLISFEGTRGDSDESNAAEEDDDDDERIAEEGVLALLNNLYKK